MKKSIYTFLILIFGSFCGRVQDNVERFIEDGVEVVLNHIQPSDSIQNLKILRFEEIYKIDTGSDTIAEKGLTDIRQFDIDSEGNLYFLNPKNPENLYFKFNKDGIFVKTFGKKGQGPGEIQSTIFFRINHLDQLEITDLQKRHLLYFNNDGKFVKETPISFSFQRALSLRNGNLIVFKDISDFNGEYLIQIPCVLFSPNFIEIKELDNLRMPNYLIGKKKKGYPQYFVLELSNEHIFIGNEERDYEILVYNFEGDLKRKIKKAYRKVEIPNDYKEKRLAKMIPKIGIWFLCLPCFTHIFI